MLAESASIGARDIAIRKVPNILVESETDEIVDSGFMSPENKPPSRLLYAEVVIINPTSTVPLRVLDHNGVLDPIADE